MINLLTVKEAGEYLRISQSKMYNLIEKRQIPHYRIGKHIKFSKQLILEWMRKKIIY